MVKNCLTKSCLVTRELSSNYTWSGTRDQRSKIRQDLSENSLFLIRFHDF